MGNILSDKKNLTPKNFTQSEFKTYVGLVEIKIGQVKAKKLKEISNKRKEIGQSLSKNQLDIAKLKMDNIINEENFIIVLDILGTLIEILKEKVVYLLGYDKCPEDVRSTLDTIIYCSNRIDIPELGKIRDGITLKYGILYVTNAINNVDKLVSLAIVDKLTIKPNPNFLLLTRLKQLALEEKIDYFFPPDYNAESEIPTNNQSQNFFNQSGNSSQMQNGYDAQMFNSSQLINKDNQLNQNMSVQINPLHQNQIKEGNNQSGYQSNYMGGFQYNSNVNSQIYITGQQGQQQLINQSQGGIIQPNNQSKINYSIMNQNVSNPQQNNFSGGFQPSQIQNSNLNNPIQLNQNNHLQNQYIQTPNYNSSFQHVDFRGEIGGVQNSQQIPQYSSNNIPQYNSQNVNSSIQIPQFNYNPSLNLNNPDLNKIPNQQKIQLNTNPSLQVPPFNYNPSVQVPQFNYNPSIQNPQLNQVSLQQSNQFNYNMSVQQPQISQVANSSIYYQGPQQSKITALPNNKGFDMSVQQPKVEDHNQIKESFVQNNNSQLNSNLNCNAYEIPQQPFGFKSELIQPNYQQPQFQYKPVNEIMVNQSIQEPKLNQEENNSIIQSKNFQSSNVFLNNQSNFLQQAPKNESNDFQLFSSSNLKPEIIPKGIETETKQHDTIPKSIDNNYQSYSYQNYKNLSMIPENNQMVHSVIIPQAKNEVGFNYIGSDIQDPYNQIGSSLNFFKGNEFNDQP